MPPAMKSLRSSSDWSQNSLDTCPAFRNPARCAIQILIVSARVAMARIAIIVGHVKSPSFCDALAKSYRNGAIAAGHTVDVFTTARMTFDPILHEGFDRLQPLRVRSRVRARSNHGGGSSGDRLSAMARRPAGNPEGFSGAGVTAECAAGRSGKFATPLTGKSARIIVTMGNPGVGVSLVVPAARGRDPQAQHSRFCRRSPRTVDGDRVHEDDR